MMTRVRRSRPPTRRPSPHNKTEGSPPDAYTTQMDLTFREDVRRQGVSNADTQTEALGGPWPGDLCAGGTRTRGATGRARGTNSTEPWRLTPHGAVGMPSPLCG